MLPLRHILVPTDFSFCAGRAFAPAADLAARSGAELHVVYVDDGGEERDPNPDTATRDLVATGLQLPPGVAPPRGLVAVERIAGHDPAWTLLAYARAHDVDLIVMGTHGHRGFRRFVMGSVAEQVVRTGDRPVLAVPCLRFQAGANVLVPVDFSEGAREALRVGRALAAEWGVGLDVLHVVDPGVLRLPYGAASSAVREADVMARAATALDEFCAGVPGGAEEDGHVQIGSPAAVVTDFARDAGSRLVVLAAHRHDGYARLPLGSVAERVIRLAPCPTLTVRDSGSSLLRPMETGLIAAEG